jgi:hypothetical protein
MAAARITAALKRRWQAWREANGRRSEAAPLTHLLESLSPTGRFLRDAMMPAQTPWTTTTPRPTAVETRPTQEVKRRPAVDVVQMLERLPDRSY